jgi:site-specific DNA-methyltransferase (adenine-specific)
MTDLRLGDCLELMKDIPNKSIDLVVTDPPYKIIQGGCTNKAVRFKGSTEQQLKNGTLFKENDIKFSDWIPEVYRVLKEDSHCYIMSNDRNLKELLNVCEETGFKLLNILVWGKSKHSPNRYYMKNCEFIALLRKGKAKNINNMGTKQLLLVDNVENKKHPSEKPTKLMQILIENSSQENDIILDPFMGSGSTGVACINANRRFIGIELDEKYFEIACERINNIRDKVS